MTVTTYRILGIIPARGGSKSIPGKNIFPLAGKPLVAYTIEVGLQAQTTDRLIVSTDDERIADVARRYGAEVPFMRPTELAQDDTPGIAPILHAVRWLEEHEKYQPDFVMCLQPTSPLRTAGDIDAAVELILQRNAAVVVSVTPVDYHPYWMKRLDAEGRIRDFITLDHPMTRRQDLPQVYALNGAIYLARREVLLEQESWYTDETYAYVMPPERSLDIDTSWDLYLTDLILRTRTSNEPH